MSNPNRRRSQSDINFLNAAKANLQQKFAPSPKTSREELEAKARTTAMAVHNYLLPILKAGGGQDKPALEATVFTMFLQAFDSKLYTKEEIIYLCSIVHTQAMMESIEADPGGTGKPDLLSGV